MDWRDVILQVYLKLLPLTYRWKPNRLEVATQNPVRSVKILSAIFNFTDAVVVRYVGRGSGVRGQPCHVSIDFFSFALGRYYTAWGAQRPSPSVVTL